MLVNFKIPYEQKKSTSPAFEIVMFVLFLIVALIWFKGW